MLHWKKAGTTPAFFSIGEHEATPISVMISSPILEHIFFKTSAGNEPVKKWLDKLGEGDKNDEKAIYADITVVAERWPQVLHTRLVKKVQGENNLWEIRSHLSRKRIARVLFTLEASENPEVNEGNDMILLHGFIKKTQKIPQKDLRLARQRKNMWRRRK